MNLNIINLSFTLLLTVLCSCKTNTPIKPNYNEPSNSFDEQLKTLNQLGYNPKPTVTKDFILDFIKHELEIANPIDSIQQNPYHLLYYALSHQDANIEGYYLTDQYFWYVLDYFEQPIAYEYFMKRMGKITDGKIKYEDVKVDFDENNIKWISFKVNGKPKKWHLGEGEFVDDSFVQRFAYLTKELKTKGKYTYFDNGGEDFIIDFATDKEQEEFNRRTGLKRIWLGEGNHFAEPKY